MAAAVAALMGAAGLGLPLRGGAADAAAVAVILGLGLPHGALDLLKLRADAAAAPGGTFDGRTRLTVYLGLAAAGGLAWAASPPFALAAFLAMAVAHFAREGAEDLPPGPALLAATLVIATPAAFHPDEVRRLFAALGGEPAGAGLTALAGACAPVLMAALFAAAVLSPPRPERGAEVLATLLALVLLPPLPAFAVFFALQHSPRHFVRAARALRLPLRPALLAAVPASLAALAIGAGTWALGSSAPASQARAAFILLAVLTVPHMTAGPLLRALSRTCGLRSAQPSGSSSGASGASSGTPSTEASSRSTETTRSALSVRST